MNRSTFGFLDSTFQVPQNIQLRIINEYAKDENLSIEFYGNELMGYENRHDQLHDKIKEKGYRNLIFYTIQQLENKQKELDIELIELIMTKEIKCYFAAQKIKLETIAERNELYLISLANNMEDMHRLE